MINFTRLWRRNKDADAARRRGDEARDARRWNDAIDAYQTYLVHRPRDFGLWVQLGHAFKENGGLDEADRAYAQARTLRPSDGDLLLNYGHLRKMQGRIEEARDLYARSLGDGFSADAVRELTALEHAPSPIRRTGTGTEALQERCKNIVIDATNDIMFDGDKALVFHTEDPWLTFTIRQDAGASPIAGTLRFKVRPDDEASPPVAKLYIDYGAGFTEKYLITLNAETAGYAVLLVNPSVITRLRWDPDERPTRMILDSIEFQPLSDGYSAEQALAEVCPPEKIADFADFAASLQASGKPTLDESIAMQQRSPSTFDIAHNYSFWLDLYASPAAGDYARMKAIEKGLAWRPKFSFVVPVYNPPVELLAECIDSMLAQTYADFELCIADDASPNPAIAEMLKDYAEADDRVKIALRPQNGHISAASNSAAALATGDFLVLVDHDDVIPDYALFTVAYYINNNPGCRILYSDEDKISVGGVRSNPYFKTEFNKFLMYGHNMVSHLGVYDRALVEEVGGFRKGLEGSQDYDLFLRCFERVESRQIVHIPHVLYHWRTIPGSTSVSADQKSYAIVAAQAAINGHFDRTNQPLRSVTGFADGHTAFVPTHEYQASISIIIPTKDGLDVLKPCLDSILARPHENIEILVVDNRSEERATARYLDEMSKAGIIRMVTHDAPFNFSAINNAAVRESRGDILCFLNNDTEVQSANWLDRARTLLALDEVGVVGARLLFPDRTLQHFGIALGMGDDGVAGTVHHGLPEHMPGYFSKARMTAEFSAVTAACMFMRRGVFDEIGGFDEDLAVAYNDVDICLRARKAGYKVLADPEIELVHKESKTRGSDAYGEKRRRLAREVAMMHRKWPGTLAADPYYSSNISLMRSDFALAYPPRVLPPWMEPGEVQKTEPSLAARERGHERSLGDVALPT